MHGAVSRSPRRDGGHRRRASLPPRSVHWATFQQDFSLTGTPLTDLRVHTVQFYDVQTRPAEGSLSHREHEVLHAVVPPPLWWLRGKGRFPRAVKWERVAPPRPTVERGEGAAAPRAQGEGGPHYSGERWKQCAKRRASLRRR